MDHTPYNSAKPLPCAPPGYGAGTLSPSGSGEQNHPARDWLAHVEAGRIGAKAAADPAVIAQREANARLFKELARHG